MSQYFNTKKTTSKQLFYKKVLRIDENTLRSITEGWPVFYTPGVWMKTRCPNSKFFIYNTPPKRTTMRHLEIWTCYAKNPAQALLGSLIVDPPGHIMYAYWNKPYIVTPCENVPSTYIPRIRDDGIWFADEVFLVEKVLY